MPHRAMSSLYADAHWSKNVTNATSRVLLSMSEGKGVTFSEGVQWLRKRHGEGDLSLSDPWGVLICALKGVPVSIQPRFIFGFSKNSGQEGG